MWVEISSSFKFWFIDSVTPSRVCELKSKVGRAITRSQCHTLTGVWVEMLKGLRRFLQWLVTPSRVCELKCLDSIGLLIATLSHPHGCVSWNKSSPSFLSEGKSHPHGCVSWTIIYLILHTNKYCHTLTGVWVEIFYCFTEIFSFSRHTLTGVWVEIILRTQYS